MAKKELQDNQDFTFVQMDKTIHDLKFQTKPTTYFKDAFKRFRKNKSSVAAGIIIGILTTMSILVPVFNNSIIDRPLFEARFLPPRVPGLDALGIMDGTTQYRNIILDTITDPDNPIPVGFVRNAIIGDIEAYDTFSNFPSPYAKGGMLVLRPDRRESDGIIYSARTTLDIETQTYTIRTQFNAFNDELSLKASFRVIASVDYEPGVATIVGLTPFSTSYETLEITTVQSSLLNARPVDVDATSFPVRFGFQVQTTSEGAYPALYVDSFQIKRSEQLTFDDPFFELVNFTSGNEVMLRDNLNNALVNRWSILSGSKSVFRAVLPRANFKYDDYEAAFGERLRVGIGESVVQSYIDSGWIAYDFTVGPSSFQLLNAQKSPLRSVTSQESFGFGALRVTTLTGVISIYRERGFSEVPYYYFGTDANGNDYFKILFSGLNTSLLLGFLVALINVSIGMVWGALSGYYGGWIDITMERFTEILGGVPWIVLMTLTILLLGSNFGTFLLALTLTGWIGTASLTRSQFYRYKRREYVLASRTLGAKDGRLIFRHILPNSIGPLVTSSVLIIPGVIFAEASISYLGLGLTGLPSLGVALSRGQQYLQTSPHLTIFGALIISLLLISFNLFGNGLRDAFNPSLKGISE